MFGKQGFSKESQIEAKKAARERLKQSLKPICFGKKEAKAMVVSIPPQNNSLNESPQSVRKRRNTTFVQLTFINSLKDVEVSQTFQECYDVGEPVGFGAHSVVYKCRQLSTNKTDAVKILKRSDQETIESLKQHYRILKSLEHSNIIQGRFLYINQKEETAHMVLELCNFADLRKFIKKKYKSDGKISETETCHILKQVLSAVQYLHNKSCCHRDLKPENILYDETSGQIKIIDFDIAKMAKYQHETVEMLTNTGTLFYRAPQSLEGGIYNEKIDIWALGIIAHELFTGTLPFIDEYKSNVVKKICFSQPVINQLQISNQAKQFLRKLLQKNPKARPSADDVSRLPFMMKNTSKSPGSTSSKSDFQQDDLQIKEVRLRKQSTTYYDQNSKYSFECTIHKDIGIRLYGVETSDPFI